MTVGLRRRRLIVAAAVIVALLTAGALAARRWWLAEPEIDPSTVALPVLSGDPVEVQTYLRGDGEPLVRFLQATADLPANSTGEQCRALADTLTTIGEPSVIMGMAAAVPDPGISDVAIQHTVSVGVYLDECLANRPLDGAARTVHFSATVFTRLLEREGLL